MQIYWHLARKYVVNYLETGSCIDVKKRFYVFYSCHVFFYVFNVFIVHTFWNKKRWKFAFYAR